MAGPGFGDLRVAESVGAPPADLPPEWGPYISDPKVQRVLELLPKIKDPERRARAVVWLRTRGLDASKEAGIDASSLGQRPATTSTTMAEEAGRLASSYDPAVIERLRSGDLGALDALRPADRADVQRKLAERKVASMAPAGHAPMLDRPEGLAAEMDARAAEQAPITRSRTGQPEPEYTHTLGERAAALGVQPASGAMVGLSRGATGGLATLPARLPLVDSAAQALGAPPGSAQGMVDELAETSAVTTPMTIASGLFPMSLGSKAAGAAAGLVPNAPAVGGLAGAGLRGAVGLGRAVAGGAAASAADATGQALNEMQQGVPAGDAMAAVPGAMASSVPASIAMYPFFSMLQRLGRTAVDDLRQSPDLGPEVLALERVGLGTRLPLLNREMSMRAIQSEAPAPSRPGKIPFTRERGPEPEGNAIAAAQREQQATGRPAATITGERAGKRVLGALASERDEMLGRHGAENEQLYQRFQGQRVSTEPVAKHISDMLQSGRYPDGTPLLGTAADNRELAKQLESVATVRWARPGERGIPPEAVRKFGLKLPPQAPAQTQGDPLGDLAAGRVRASELDYIRDPESFRPESRAARDAPYKGITSREDATRVAMEQEPIDLRLNEQGKWFVVDGRHRLEAAVKAGADGIRVRADAGDGPRELTMRFGRSTAPPGGRKQSPRLVIEAKEMTAEELEKSINAIDQLASVARNVEKSQSEQAARSVGAVLRQMRHDFRTMGGDHVFYDRPGNDLRETTPGGEITSSYGRTKEAHGREQLAYRDKLKELGLAERVEKLRPEDANQMRAVVGKIMGGDPALQKLFPDNPEAQRELRIAAAHAAFDRLYGTATAGKPNLVAGPSGPHGILTLGGSARLAFDPIARGLAGTGLSEAAQRGLSGSRSGRVAAQIPPETVNQFLAMIGLGSTEEDQ